MASSLPDGIDCGAILALEGLIGSGCCCLRRKYLSVLARIKDLEGGSEGEELVLEGVGEVIAAAESRDWASFKPISSILVT